MSAQRVFVKTALAVLSDVEKHALALGATTTFDVRACLVFPEGA